MKVDRYYDPYEDLEKKVIKDIEYAATRLGGTMQKISKRDSMGRSCLLYTSDAADES